MATRRNVPPTEQQQQRTLAPSQGGGDASSLTSDTSPAIPMSVIYKLLAFTFAMFGVPIGSYYFSVRFLFSGSPQYAGGVAAVMANVVLAGFIIAAVREDQSEQIDAGKEQKKAL